MLVAYYLINGEACPKNVSLNGVVTFFSSIKGQTTRKAIGDGGWGIFNAFFCLLFPCMNFLGQCMNIFIYFSLAQLLCTSPTHLNEFSNCPYPIYMYICIIIEKKKEI